MSCGPGLASGCPWKQNAGASVSRKPCSEPSKSETCVTLTFAGSPLVHREAVILARDVNLLGLDVEHGVVGAVVAEFHLQRPAADRQTHDLVAQADAEVGTRRAMNSRVASIA